MKKQTKSNWQNTAFAVIASVAFMFALCSQAAAQSEIQFDALYNCPDSNMHYFKVLDCADGKDCKVLFVNTSTPSASYEWKVEKSKILSAFKTGGCTIEGKSSKRSKIIRRKKTF